MEILQKEFDQLMEAGLITESQSEWSAPAYSSQRRIGVIPIGLRLPETQQVLNQGSSCSTTKN